MASDSRVSWVDNDTGLSNKWFDSSGFLKTLTIDDVMYGFAGTNVMFKLFMENYTVKEEAESVLDSIVLLGKQEKIQFFIMRYDGNCLKLFAYSPSDPSKVVNDEIFRISSDPSIDLSVYAIGSGKRSKQYKTHKLNQCPAFPIKKIITANYSGMKKTGMLQLNKVVNQRVLTSEESIEVFSACYRKGGDIFTGGDVNMANNITQEAIDKQVKVLDDMNKQAKANKAVCASPVDATFEVSQLESLGQYSVSPNQVTMTKERIQLMEKMTRSLAASI